MENIDEKQENKRRRTKGYKINIDIRLRRVSFKGERWTRIQDYHPYFISSFGRIYSSKRDIIMKLQLNDGGYLTTKLVRDDGCHMNVYAHILVAVHFLEKDEDPLKNTVDHIDRNRQNNHLDNLCWASSKEQSANKSKRDYKIVCKVEGEEGEESFNSLQEMAEAYFTTEENILDFVKKTKVKGEGHSWSFRCVAGNITYFFKHKKYEIKKI